MLKSRSSFGAQLRLTKFNADSHSRISSATANKISTLNFNLEACQWFNVIAGDDCGTLVEELAKRKNVRGHEMRLRCYGRNAARHDLAESCRFSSVARIETANDLQPPVQLPRNPTASDTRSRPSWSPLVACRRPPVANAIQSPFPHAAPAPSRPADEGGSNSPSALSRDRKNPTEP